MLLDVTAFLSTSASINSVAEAFSVSETLQASISSPVELTADRAAWNAALESAGSTPVVLPAPRFAAPRSAAAGNSAATDNPWNGVPQPFVGPVPGTSKVSFDVLPTLTGAPLLTQLSLLTPSQLSDFVASNPQSVTALIATPPSASVVESWWGQADHDTQAALLTSAPQLIGSLEGVPYGTRDVANRRFLADSEQAIQDQLNSGVGRAEQQDLKTSLHMLEQVGLALTVGTSGNARELILLDPAGQGRAVIAIGDLASADYVNYLVPGMFSSVDTQIVAAADKTDEFATDQQRMLATLPAPTGDAATPAAATASHTPTVAAIAWLGYHSPSIVDVASMDLAREGQQALTQSLQGLVSLRGAHQPYLAIIAHSYGSTAALLSLQDDQVSVDALAIIGSPGSPATSVSDLKVRDGNVWVGAAALDPVPQTGIFGSQPLSPQYGAHHFSVDGAVDPQTGQALTPALGHNDYFVTGTESMHNMELVGIGRGDLVLGNDGAAALAGKALAIG